VNDAAPTRYLFVPGEMRRLAATLDRGRSSVDAAVLALLLVYTTGLPAKVRSAVDSELASLRRLLTGVSDGLSAGSRYVSGTAERVERLDEQGFFRRNGPLVKVGDAVLGETVDIGLDRGDRAARARRWARVLAALTGTSVLAQAASWSEWRSTARKLARGDGWRTATRVTRLRAAVDARVGEGLRANYGVRTPSREGPRAGSGFRRLGRTAAGALPYAGTAVDAWQYRSDWEKLRRDEPQTGVSQALTDIRDFTALVGSSNHLAADVCSLTGPVGLPGAAINESIGYAADGAVLTMDGAAWAGKRVAHAGGAALDKAAGLARSVFGG
jgi:hypothetical protein